MKFGIENLKLFSVPLCLCGLSVLLSHPAHADDARDAVIVETLLKLKRQDLSTVKPETRNAALRHIDAHRGTTPERFVELVELFDVRDRTPELLRVVAEMPDDPAGISAARVLLKWGELDRLREIIDGDNERAASAAVRAVGATQHKAGLRVLADLAGNAERSTVLRSDAVRALGRGPAGERLLLALAADEKLSEELKPIAAAVMLISRDSAVREEASAHLRGFTSDTKLPPVTELVKQRGDPERGAAVYLKATCFTCHKVGEDTPGIDFGPALTEIGSKLARQALYESILAPSAGISFGYEGQLVTLKNGQQLLGYVASETDEQIVLKQMGGVSTPIKKSDIQSRQAQPQSLMPPNLHLLITEQELVDLVEYLASLKKK